ncbi:hypothetical protein FA15DRAFT_708011, partial [Coprinopsis marcescibilis]
MDIPPSYSSEAAPGTSKNTVDDSGTLPTYTFPTKFVIGGVPTDSLLITAPEIKGHLALLNAFAELKKNVHAWPDSIPNMPPDEEKRWGWFVNMAVERFDRWVRALKPTDDSIAIEDVLPPIDVLMVWHSYMLNPRWYAEDGQRLGPILQPLHSIGGKLAASLHHLPEILSTPPSARRVELFKERV